jgi:hypothetical protein
MTEDHLDLETARKRYHRRQTIREGILATCWFLLLPIPWMFSFSRVEILVWYVGAIVLLQFARTQHRLNAMKLTLAMVRDDLAEVTGKEYAEDRLHELLALQ